VVLAKVRAALPKVTADVLQLRGSSLLGVGSPGSLLGVGSPVTRGVSRDWVSRSSMGKSGKLKAESGD
jgi:hypothetical protein